MRILPLIILLITLMGCHDGELSYISISNETPFPIYALSYTSEYSDGDWIQPGLTDEFYSIGIGTLNGFEYFSAYYDSLIIFVKDYEDEPVKFYSDGVTVNYDPKLNPFTNSDVWQTRAFKRHLPETASEGLEEKWIFEDYFSIEISKIISLCETNLTDSDSAL
jgi:hypothetical protein